MNHAFVHIADLHKNRLHSLFPAEEWIAYSQQFLPTGKDSLSDWEPAMAQAHRSLVGKTIPEAERLVKTAAASVLHRPSILEAFEEREASRLKLAEAQAEDERIQQKEVTEQTFALQRTQLDARKAEADARWGRNWDAEIRTLEAEVEKRVSKPGQLSVQDQSWINFWCAEIHRFEVFKRIAARRTS